MLYMYYAPGCKAVAKEWAESQWLTDVHGEQETTIYIEDVDAPPQHIYATRRPLKTWRRKANASTD